MKYAARYVADGSRPHKSTSFELPCLSEGFPKRAAEKSFFRVNFAARWRSAESHPFTKFRVAVPAGSRPHKSTSFELLCLSEGFPRRAVANSFFV